jgi:RNA polymerase sigma-70 factor (ECF subfamily)
LFGKNRQKQRFKDLTYAQYERLYRLAYSRVGHRQEAEDIVQETYLKAYKAFHTLRDNSNIEAWLTQILMNTVRDYIRKLSHSPTLVSVDDDNAHCPEFPEATRRSPEEELCSQEVDSEILEALRSLPDTFLSVFLLREIDGASYQEISQILRIPSGTVMSRLSRARELLRSQLFPARKTSQSKQKGESKNIAEVES